MQFNAKSLAYTYKTRVEILNFPRLKQWRKTLINFSLALLPKLLKRISFNSLSPHTSLSHLPYHRNLHPSWHSDQGEVS